MPLYVRRRQGGRIWCWGLLAALVAAGLAQPNSYGQKKVAVPNEQAQKQALKKIQFEHKSDYLQAKDDAKSALTLANLLLNKADSAADPAEKFVRLHEAMKFGAAAGDLSTVLSAAEELENYYHLDSHLFYLDALQVLADNTEGTEASALLVEEILLLITQSLAEDRYELAEGLGEIAEQAARRAKDLPLVLSIHREQEGIQKAKKTFAGLKPFVDRLKKDPSDAEANLHVGKYTCFLKGEWEKGLYFLAQCNDQKLRLQAQRDLIHPEETKAQVEIGDSWWTIAGDYHGQVKVHIRQRAVFWYEQAVYAAEGELQNRLEERIAAVPPPRNKGIVWDYNGPPGAIKTVGRHFGSIYAVAYSPNGQTVASGSSDNRAILWDVKTGKKLITLQGHTSTIWGIAYGPRGKYIFTSSWDGSAMMWDAKTGKMLRRFPNAGRFGSMYGIAVSPDGKHLITGASDSSVRLWDIKTGKMVRQMNGHRGAVYGVAFSPDGRKALTSGSFDRTLILWDLKTGKELKRITNAGTSIRYVAISPNGNTAVAAGQAQVRLWDLKTGKELRQFRGHTGVVYALAFSPDGKRLITGGSDRTIRYWDVKSGKLLRTFTGHTSTVYSLAFSPGGGRVVSGSIDNTIRLWGMPR